MEKLEGTAAIDVPLELSKPHLLVSRTRRILRSRASGRARRYVDCYTREEPEPLPFVVDVSDELADRAFRILDALVQGFAEHGFPTRAVKQEEDSTARVAVLGEEYGLHIREPLRQRPFDPKKEGEEWRSWHPKIVRERSGRLTVSLVCRSVPRNSRSWSDSETRKIESVLLQVVKTAVKRVQDARRIREEIRIEEEERRRQEQARREAEEARRREEKRRRIERQRVEALVEQASAWARARELRRFAAACRAAACDSDGRTQPDEATESWLRWVSSVADRIDPLADGLAAVQRATEPKDARPFARRWNSPAPQPGSFP